MERRKGKLAMRRMQERSGVCLNSKKKNENDDEKKNGDKNKRKLNTSLSCRGFLLPFPLGHTVVHRLSSFEHIDFNFVKKQVLAMQNDEELLRKLEKKGKEEYEDPNGEYLGSFKCALKNAGCMGDIEAKSLKNKDVLFKYIIMYSFERQGFDAKMKECKIKCEWCKKDKKNRPKQYAVKVLEALKWVENELKSNSSRESKYIALRWKEKFEDVTPKKLSKRIKPEYFDLLVEFYKKELDKFIYYICDGELKEAYKSLEKIHGIGDKISRCLIRDLVQFLRNGKIDDIKESEKEYLIPIDIWVKRVALAIPCIKKEFLDIISSSLENDEKRKEFLEGIIKAEESKKINEFLRKAILKVCEEHKINPIYFDAGCYYVGAKKLKKKQLNAGEILKELKNIFAER